MSSCWTSDRTAPTSVDKKVACNSSKRLGLVRVDSFLKRFRIRRRVRQLNCMQQTWHLLSLILKGRLEVGGDDGHEREIFQYRVNCTKERSPAGWDDRFQLGGLAGIDHPTLQEIFQYRVNCTKERSPAGWDDRFPRGRRAVAGVSDGERLRRVAAGGSGCCLPGGERRLLYADSPTGARESSIGDVTRSSGVLKPSCAPKAVATRKAGPTSPALLFLGSEPSRFAYRAYLAESRSRLRGSRTVTNSQKRSASKRPETTKFLRNSATRELGRKGEYSQISPKT